MRSGTSLLRGWHWAPLLLFALCGAALLVSFLFSDFSWALNAASGSSTKRETHTQTALPEHQDLTLAVTTEDSPALKHDLGRRKDDDHRRHKTPAEQVLFERGKLDSKTYNVAEDKGKNLLCGLQDPSRLGELATSPYNNIEQLEEWGWVREVDSRDDESDYSHVVRQCHGLAERIGTDLTSGKKRKLVHGKTVKHEEVTYYATGGEYVNVYWPEQGILMANDNYSPAYQADHGQGDKVPFKDAKGNTLPLPKLKQWSDVNALTYASLSPSLAQNLRFIFRRNIKNKATKDLIGNILQKNNYAGNQAPVWPGKTFTPKSQGFAALMATPNVGGILWMVIQHQGVLGKKGIKSVTIWQDREGPYTPHMLVELDDAEEE